MGRYTATVTRLTCFKYNLVNYAITTEKDCT